MRAQASGSPSKSPPEQFGCSHSRRNFTFGSRFQERLAPQCVCGVGEACRLPQEQAGPNRWRLLAANAREVAARLHDPHAVRIMLRIAEAYDRLAERAEKSIEIEKEPGK
jgi:hypothetical protein